MAKRPHSEPSLALHRFAVITGVCTFILVVAGSLVTSTGSGLAVPDWPLSYGMLFPPMIGGILYEHGHRMIAGAVALLTTVLMVWTWIREPRRWVRSLAIGAWVTVLVQAVLGGLTVLLLLPTPVSVGHAGVAQLFFMLVVTMALVTSPYWRRIDARPASSPTLHRLTLLVLVAVYGQMLLGAWVRHTGSGLAIPDFPLAYGGLVPPLSAEALETVNHHLVIDLDLPRIESMSQVAIHFLHRLGALAVVGAAAALLVGTLQDEQREPKFLLLAVAMAGLIAAQVALGALTVWTGRSVLASTGHVAVGALTSAAAAAYVLLCRRTRVLIEKTPQRVREAAVSSAEEGRAHA